MPISRPSTPPATSPDDPIGSLPFGCPLMMLGLVLGGGVGFILIGNDPFDVTTVPARAVGEIAQDDWGIEKYFGLLATFLTPFLVSGLCGVFAHKSLPASILAALLRMMGVGLLLFGVAWVGSRVIEQAMGTDEPSDVGTPLTVIAFDSLCVSLVAPLSSALIRRRLPVAPGEVRQPARKAKRKKRRKSLKSR